MMKRTDCPVRLFQRGELEPGPRTLYWTRPCSPAQIARAAGLPPDDAPKHLKILKDKGWLQEIPCTCGRCPGSIYLMQLPEEETSASSTSGRALP